MKQRKLGRCGLEVSAIGSACMGLPYPVLGHGLAAASAAALSRAQQIRVIRAAHDFGVTLFDVCAPAGADPEAREALLGEAIAPLARRVAVAAGFSVGAHGGLRQIRQAAEATLTRLKIDAIDLFCLQRPDTAVPMDAIEAIEDVAGAVAELVQAGKVKRFGLSEPTPEQLHRAHAVLPVSVVRAPYSLWDRRVEDGLLPAAEALGIGFMALSPLGAGVLADSAPLPCRPAPPALHSDLLIHLAHLASRHAATPAQIALAWLLAQKPWIVPMPGTRRIGHTDENLGGADIVLSAQDLRGIDTVLGESRRPTRSTGAARSFSETP